MTSVVNEHVGRPGSTRDARALRRTRARAADELAGRTVWCATALPSGQSAARTLRTCLGTGGSVAAGSLEVAAGEPLRPLAQRLDDILRTATATASPIGRGDRAPLGPAEAEIYALGQGQGEMLLGAGVARDDVVVLHDALAAVLAQAVRERGAHVVWDVKLGVAAPGQETARDAWAFLRRYTSAIDAFLMSWLEPGDRGQPVERIAAVMPSVDIVATKELPMPGEQDTAWQDVGWSSVLADVVHRDRDEHVGGRLHARPAVAAR
ncbi:MAG: hypothetical protein QOF29_1758 [bacterium]|jgi:hypothetical protein